MTEQKNKFAVELVWHNCLTYKPEEKFNQELYVTDGTKFYLICPCEGARKPRQSFPCQNEKIQISVVKSDSRWYMKM